MSNTKNDPMNSSHIPRAGATLPRPPLSADDREQRPVLPSYHPLQQNGHTMDRAKGPAKHAGAHGHTDDHGNVIKKSSRTLPSKTRIKGCVRRWDRRAPPPRKSNAWDAGAVSAHVTCENDARDSFPAAQKADSVKGREGGLGTDQYSFPPDPYQGHSRDERARHTGPASSQAGAGEHGSVTPSPACRARQEAPEQQHEPSNPHFRTPHCGTDTPAAEPARHGTIRHTTGRQTRARAPHHRAGAAT